MIGTATSYHRGQGKGTSMFTPMANTTDKQISQAVAAVMRSRAGPLLAQKGEACAVVDGSVNTAKTLTPTQA